MGINFTEYQVTDATTLIREGNDVVYGAPVTSVCKSGPKFMATKARQRLTSASAAAPLG